MTLWCIALCLFAAEGGVAPEEPRAPLAFLQDRAEGGRRVMLWEPGSPPRPRLEPLRHDPRDTDGSPRLGWLGDRLYVLGSMEEEEGDGGSSAPAGESALFLASDARQLLRPVPGLSARRVVLAPDGSGLLTLGAAGLGFLELGSGEPVHRRLLSERRAPGSLLRAGWSPSAREVLLFVGPSAEGLAAGPWLLPRAPGSESGFAEPRRWSLAQAAEGSWLEALDRGGRDARDLVADPDGRWLASVRRDGEGSARLSVMPVEGGELRALGPGDRPAWGPVDAPRAWRVHRHGPLIQWEIPRDAELTTAVRVRRIERALDCESSHPELPFRALVFQASEKEGKYGVYALHAAKARMIIPAPLEEEAIAWPDRDAAEALAFLMEAAGLEAAMTRRLLEQHGATWFSPGLRLFLVAPLPARELDLPLDPAGRVLMLRFEGLD